VAEVRRELTTLRRAVIEESARHGLAPVAASSHPFSLSARQQRTDKERYVALLEEMQGVARRMMVCGLHVHVGIDDDELRIDLMNQLTYFVPHLLALSCSSPFWERERTGLMSFRVMVFNGLPRAGLPERFDSWGEYRRHTDTLIESGVIVDTSRIWWDLRPSARYPTLETRVMDCCTTLEDTVRLAALNQCLLRMLYRLRRSNQMWRTYPNLLVGENRWRAMRYSYDAGLLDLGRQRIVPFAELLEEIIELVREDAAALDCTAEIEGLREIVTRGTSAHQQLRAFDDALRAGATEAEALKRVVDWLIAETARL
jgi:carboxylate-amine ligase